MKKIIVLLGTAALLVSLIFAGVCITRAVGNEPQLSIYACNLSFSDTIYIKYAVSYEFADEDDVSLLIWTQPENEYLFENKSAQLTAVSKETINDTDCLIFDYKALAAKQMTDVVYAAAYTRVGDVDYYSGVQKYSILQYAFNKLGKTGDASSDENLKTMLTKLLEYGAAAQTYFDYNTDRLATADYFQVKTVGGAIDDRSADGLYLPGEQITVSAPPTDSEGKVFDHWEGAGNTILGYDSSYTYTVTDGNEVLTAVYVSVSSGLEFESNGDGTACLTGMGSCADTELVIPSKTPDGDTVTEIDNSAFAGEPITSVTIPATVTSIGRKAFQGCSSLTDVYYGGTEEQWDDISIGTQNQPLLDATIHFATANTHTVTFLDWDGSTLKTQTVNNGEDATPPTDPTREGYTFSGWSGSYTNVTADVTVTAAYMAVSGPTIVVNEVTAHAGDTVELSVRMLNNPGIIGMTLSLQYDENALSLTSVEKGSALSEMTFTSPKALKSGCQFPWDAEAVLPENATNGEILTLTFQVLNTAENGTYPITLAYNNGAIIDNNMLPVSMSIVNGSITIQ